MIFKEYFDQIMVLLPIIATAFGGIGIGIIYLHNKLKIK